MDELDRVLPGVTRATGIRLDLQAIRADLSSVGALLFGAPAGWPDRGCLCRTSVVARGAVRTVRDQLGRYRKESPGLYTDGIEVVAKWGL